jgi:NDP-sugar pyrophosphorylase family protein
MKAMILAAGLGTRLRPLTDDRPKALVTVVGHTLLEIALLRLRSFGVREVIVNAHHHAEMIVDYLKANDFGMHVEVSCENELLDTGGGLKNAAAFFFDSKSREEPFILHNVDVISDIDLAYMVEFHMQRKAIATLAVQDRESSRQLLFDEQGKLCGRQTRSAARPEGVQEDVVLPVRGMRALAFSGIHVVSPQLFSNLTEQGTFSIIDAYLRLAAEGEKIVAFRADDCYWRDLGRPESIAQASDDLRSGKFTVV